MNVMPPQDPYIPTSITSSTQCTQTHRGRQWPRSCTRKWAPAPATGRGKLILNVINYHSRSISPHLFVRSSASFTSLNDVFTVDFVKVRTQPPLCAEQVPVRPPAFFSSAYLSRRDAIEVCGSSDDFV